MSDPQTVALFSLADRMNKTIAELIELPETEILGWFAYFEHTQRDK